VDAYLAVVSKREVRDYAGRELLEDVVRRILDAGRLAGSSRNSQPWRFLLVRDSVVRERLAATVYAPGNVLSAALVIAIAVRPAGPAAFDGGRAAQNMMLAAWNEGVGSCPNGLADRAGAAEVLGLEADEVPLIVLSLGYPARPWAPEARPAEEWIARADRKPLDEVARYL
jgi:nitroreductase